MEGGGEELRREKNMTRKRFVKKKREFTLFFYYNQNDIVIYEFAIIGSKEYQRDCLIRQIANYSFFKPHF